MIGPDCRASSWSRACAKLASKIERETRFYITSLALLASGLGPLVRDHWAVENSLHWVMDMVFRDDECRVRKDHAPANFTTIKHMASNLMRNATAKGSMRLKRKAAAWDDDFLASLVVHEFLRLFSQRAVSRLRGALERTTGSAAAPPERLPPRRLPKSRLDARLHSSRSNLPKESNPQCTT